MNIVIVHTLNRGVEKRKLFLDDGDYFRFIQGLYLFNNENWVNRDLRRMLKVDYSADIASRQIQKNPRKKLVEVLAFALMPNHYHLLLAPKKGNSVSKFMKKLNMGYAKYFNEKYDRRGTLFESRYKSVPITNQAHLLYMPYYIHLNPLDLIAPEWRERRMKNYNHAVKFLENYRWSSFLDYIGQKNFPSVISKSPLQKLFNNPEHYKNETYNWLKEMKIGSIDSSLCLE